MATFLFFYTCSALIYTAYSACKWNNLDLSALSSNTIQCVYGRYALEYTPCSNKLQCELDDEYMVIQYDTGSNECILHTAEWDNGATQPSHIHNESITLYNFEYTNGATGSGCDNGRHTQIKFICDENAKPYDGVECGESAQIYGVCNYWILIHSHLACNGASTSSDAGLSTGSILLIVACSVFVMYCVAGYMMNGFKSDNFKDCRNNTPHYSFWTKLPFLVVAGCKVSYEFVKGQGKGQNDDDTQLIELDNQ